MAEFDYSKLKYIGTDVYISDKAIIKRPELFECGDHIAIDEFCIFTTQIKLGNYIHIAPMTTCIGGKDARFIMGNFTTIAAGCRIIVRGDSHRGVGLVSPVIPDEFRDEVIGEEITMEDYSSLGTNVIIMPNVTIPKGCVIGANSLVKESSKLEEWSIYIGNPVKFLMKRHKDIMLEFGKKLLDNK